MLDFTVTSSGLHKNGLARAPQSGLSVASSRQARLPRSREHMLLRSRNSTPNTRQLRQHIVTVAECAAGAAYAAGETGARTAQQEQQLEHQRGSGLQQHSTESIRSIHVGAYSASTSASTLRRRLLYSAARESSTLTAGSLRSYTVGALTPCTGAAPGVGARLERRHRHLVCLDAPFLREFHKVAVLAAEDALEGGGGVGGCEHRQGGCVRALPRFELRELVHLDVVEAAGAGLHGEGVTGALVLDPRHLGFGGLGQLLAIGILLEAGGRARRRRTRAVGT